MAIVRGVCGKVSGGRPEAGRGDESLLLEDEVGGGGAWRNLGPVRDAGRDVDGVSRVEGDLFASGDFGAAGFVGLVRQSVGALYGAAGHEDDSALSDDHLVGPVGVEFGIACVDA